MEFSFRVSEKDYLNAWKLRRPGGFAGSRTFKTVMFWVFILVCLMLLWGIVTRNRADTPVEEAPASTPINARAVIVNLVPFVAIAGVWIAMLVRLGPRTLRGLYRKDPAMQGTYSVKITTDSILLANSAGISTETRWSIYGSWREGKNLIVLMLYSGAYFILVLSDLSEAERNELRNILAAAIPRT